VGAKKCLRCGFEKQLPEFNFDRSRRDGRAVYCKQCNAEKCRQQYKDNSESRKKYTRSWRFRYYQITAAEAEWLLTVYQKGLCLICCEKVSIGQSHIDHAHRCSSEKHYKSSAGSYGCKKCIRGILHKRCNMLVISFLERFPHLQTEEVQKYLSSRPLASCETIK